MALPSDIKLPADARYYQFVEKDLKFNSNYDIVWSFQFKVPGDLGHTGSSFYAQESAYEYAFGTFLTTLTSEHSSLPGQYVGDLDPGVALSGGQLLTEASAPITTETGVTDLTVDSVNLSGQLIKIVFDSTGLYGLSGREGRDGVALKDVKRNSLCIRDYNRDLIYYEYLSAFSPTIPLTSDSLNTVRIRYANLGSKLSIDRKIDSTYQTLTTLDIPFRLETYNNLENIFVGYSFCTPISTSSPQLSVSKFFFKDPHIEGLVTPQVLTETISSDLGDFNPNTTYTIVENVTAKNDECVALQIWEASQQVAEYRELHGISESVPVELTGEVVANRGPCSDFVLEISGTRGTRTIVTETVARPEYTGDVRIRITDGARVTGDTRFAVDATPLCIQSEWNESWWEVVREAVVMPAHWRGGGHNRETSEFNHWDSEHAEWASLSHDQRIQRGYPDHRGIVARYLAEITEEAVREQKYDLHHWHAYIDTDKGTVKVEQSNVATPWWRADGIPECSGPDVTTRTETVVDIPGQEVGSIPKERAHEFAIDNNVTIQGHYRSREFLIPINTLSIFS